MGGLTNLTMGSGSCLVIGGSGPSGPHIIDGLLSRGWSVTMLHTGAHPAPRDWYQTLDKILANPHRPETVKEALGNRHWDLAIVTYGKVALLAPMLATHASRLITVGGFVLYRDFALFQAPIPLREDSPLATSTGDINGTPNHPNPKINQVVLAERAVFAAFPEATHFRYPVLYGPGQIAPSDWSIVRRVMAGKPVILPDGGTRLLSQCYGCNAAHAVLLAVDQPKKAVGRTFNVADDTVLSLRQRAEIIIKALNSTVECVSMPGELAPCTRPLTGGEQTLHTVLCTSAIREHLGYRDLVTAELAVAETARWLAQHPVSEAISSKVLQDPFDLSAEQQLLEAWRRGDIAACGRVQWQPFDPGFGSFYYGAASNPASPGLTQQGRHQGEWTSLEPSKL